MHLRVQTPRVSFHVVPVAEVPSRVDCHRRMLLHNVFNLLLLNWVIFAKMLVPHVLDKLGKFVPVHQVAIAVKLSALHLHVVLASDGLDAVNFQRLGPLLQLFEPVFFVLRQEILFRVVQDALGSLRLLELIIGLNQLLDRVFRGIVKLLLPVVESFRICIAILGYRREGLGREKFDVLTFIQLHEFCEIEDLLEDLNGLAWSVLCRLEALQNLLLLVLKHLTPAVKERDAVKVLGERSVHLS